MAADYECTKKWLKCCGDYNSKLEHVGCTSECPYWESDFSCNPWEPFEDALEVLSDLRKEQTGTMKRLYDEMAWIPVSRALPESEDAVIVSDGKEYAIGRWNKDKKIWEDTDGSQEGDIRWLGEITYWKAFGKLPAF